MRDLPVSRLLLTPSSPAFLSRLLLTPSSPALLSRLPLTPSSPALLSRLPLPPSQGLEAVVSMHNTSLSAFTEDLAAHAAEAAALKDAAIQQLRDDLMAERADLDRQRDSARKMAFENAEQVPSLSTLLHTSPRISRYLPASPCISSLVPRSPPTSPLHLFTPSTHLLP